MSQRAPIRIALGTGLVAFLVYSLTSPVGICWEHSGEDGPEFAAVARVLGIAHPTGYPLFTLLARIASIGANENAWRVQLFVNLTAAAAVMMAFLYFRRVAGTRTNGESALVEEAPSGSSATIGALVGAALFAFSPIWWAQSTIIEVYPLHIFFVATLLWLAMATDGWPSRLLLLAWIGGLALAHHRMAALAGPSLLALSLAALWRYRPIAWRYVAAAVPLALAPLTLYFVLMLRSRLNPPLDWGNPESWSSLFWVFRGEQYSFRMFHEPLSKFAERAREVLFLGTPEQFAWSALGLVLLGLVVFRRRRGAAVWWALVAYFLVQLTAYAGYDIPDPDAYSLPLTFVLCGFAAVGADWLWGDGSKAPRRRLLSRLILAALLVGPAIRLPSLWQRTSLHEDHGAEEYSRDVMAFLPQHAVVLTDGDGRSFSLWYRQLVDHRDDVSLVYRLLLVWPWYHENLAVHDPTLALSSPGTHVRDVGREFLSRNLPSGRPLYTTVVDEWLATSFAVAPEGHLFRVLGERTPAKAPLDPVRARPIDLSSAANADYRLDPFRAGSTDSTGFFGNLGGGHQRWGDLPIAIARPRNATGTWSVWTSGSAVPMSARVPLSPESTREIVLLTDAWTGSANLPLGSARVLYTTGPPDSVAIISCVNVWDFHAESHDLRLPEDVLVWHGPLDQSLTALPIPVDPGRTPVALELSGGGSMLDDGRPAAWTLFGAEQVFSFR